MTATFWTGSSLSFTNGSKTVTVNTGPSLDSVKANSSLTAGNYNEPVEVKSVSGNTITLYNNWPGSTGTSSATIKPSAAAAASAGVAAQQLITDIQSLVSSASVTATANSFVKRDSNGRIKAATPSANDDVVNKGYLGSAATKNAGTSAGNVMEVGAFGIGDSMKIASPDLNTLVKSGFYYAFSSTNSPDNETAGHLLVMGEGNAGTVLQMFTPYIKDRTFIRRKGADGVWGDWQELHHSGNTNFNEFGGVQQSDDVALGVGVTSSLVNFHIPLNSNTAPTSVTVVGSFEVEDVSRVAIDSGISSFTVSGRSGNKMLVLSVSGLSGIVVGGIYHLSTESATSKITVNF